MEVIKIRRNCKYKKAGLRSGEFMEVVLLTLLLDGPSYGYKLIEDAASYGINPEMLARGVAYKILRKLEMMGLVESYWDTSESGMPKRMYRITDAGKEYLNSWASEIHEVIENIEKIVEAIGSKAATEDLQK